MRRKKQFTMSSAFDILLQKSVIIKKKQFYKVALLVLDKRKCDVILLD